MYASYVEAKMKPGLSAQAIEMAKGMISEVGQIPNIKQFTLINKVDDNVLLTALYDTAEDQEAAVPNATELLGHVANPLAETAERKQVEVPINHTYLRSAAGG